MRGKKTRIMEEGRRDGGGREKGDVGGGQIATSRKRRRQSIAPTPASCRVRCRDFAIAHRVHLFSFPLSLSSFEGEERRSSSFSSAFRSLLLLFPLCLLIYIYIYLSPFPRFVAGIFPSPRGYVRGLRCTSRFSSLFVHVVVCRRRRRMPRWFVCVPYNLDAYSRTSSNRSYRLRRSSFSSLSTPFSLLLFIYPSCFPWFKGCR